MYDLRHNAYHILGLDISTGSDNFNKHSRELINHIKIGDQTQFDLDFGTSEKLRTEDSIKDALNKLKSFKEAFREYFFWFDIGSGIDEKASKEISKKKYDNAIRIWENASEGRSKRAYKYKKNLAILYNLLLYENDKESWARDSIAIWDSLVTTDRFWESLFKDFSEAYSGDVDKSILADARREIPETLSDIYTHYYQIHKNSFYIRGFQEVFAIEGKGVSQRISEPAYRIIEKKVAELESLKVSEDGILDQDEIRTIKSLVGSMQAELNNLMELGLYESSHTKVVRDRAAEGIRTIVLDLHNNLSQTEKSISLLEIALEITGTSTLETKIKKDIRTVNEIKEQEDLVGPIAKLVEKKEYAQALRLIDIEAEKYKDKKSLQAFYKSQKKLCVSLHAAEMYKDAMDKFNQKMEEDSKAIFKKVQKLIYENLDLFDFNKASIDNIIEDIKKNIKKATLSNLSHLDSYRQSVVDIAKRDFAEDEFEGTILIMLADSYIYGGLAPKMKEVREKMRVVNVLYFLGWLTIWWGWGVVFFIGGWIYKSSID
ncbi:MAG: hypothetical protein WD883_00395 [Candidatus Colwellbacteria bacterium]